MQRSELATLIRATARLTGSFLLRSGQTSDFYWDKYRFESDPILLRAVATEMSKLIPENCSRLAAMEMGGIPLGTAIALQVELPVLFVRKEAKEYGTCHLVEGGFEVPCSAVVIEDVITTAGQVIKSIRQMRERGIEIDTVVAAIDRQQGGAERLQEIGVELRSAFTLSELDSLP